MPQDTPSRKLDQYIVRFPEGMRDVLKYAAEENGRSMNAEIIQRLQDSLEVEEAGGQQAYLMGEMTGQVSGALAVLGGTVEQLVASIDSLTSENKLLREEVSALHKQLPKE